MKQRMTILCLAAALAAQLCACQAGGSNSGNTAASTNANSNASSTNSGAKVDRTAVVSEIREVLAAHDKALNDKNLDALMGVYSTDPNTVMLGTGSEERWVGAQEIRAAYTEIIKDYDPGTLQCNCDWKTGGADDAGTMAWLAANCACKDSHAGKTRDYKLNVSAALEKQDGKWRFVMLHMSNAFQPPVTK